MNLVLRESNILARRAPLKLTVKAQRRRAPVTIKVRVHLHCAHVHKLYMHAHLDGGDERRGERGERVNEGGGEERKMDGEVRKRARGGGGDGGR